MEVSFAEYINDVIRIMIILYLSRENKSIRLTERKIELYDFFLRFPKAMTDTDLPLEKKEWNFDEYYAFFHWQPDIIRYRQALNYLIAKNFAEKTIEESSVIYSITDIGADAFNSISNEYKNNLAELMAIQLPKLNKLSDTKIEEMIRTRSKAFAQKGGIADESQN